MAYLNGNKILLFPKKGEAGKSAYEVAVENGYVGTEEQWLASLAQGAPEYAEDISGCTDTKKLYVLPNGYIYAYYAKNIIITSPNLFNAETTTLNKKLKTDGVSLADAVGTITTDYIAADCSSFEGNYVIRVKGVSDDWIINAKIGTTLAYYDADKTLLAAKYLLNGTTYHYTITTDSEGRKCFDISIYDGAALDFISNTKYIRMSFAPTGSKTASVTAADIQNIEIAFDGDKKITPVTAWYSTGLTYTPADYEPDIVALKNTATEHEARIENLEKEVGTSAYAIPTYWESEVEAAISAIKEKQKTLGQKAVSFALAADMHIDTHQFPNYQYSENIGKIAAKIMSECNIPFMLVLGDNNSGAATIADDPTYIYDAVAKQDEILKPIGKEKVLKLLGNHDGVWGQTTTDGNTVYYDRAISRAERFDLFMSPQGEDTRRVWGDNGTYFYVDYPQRKARFICLNSQDTAYNVGDDYYSTDAPARNPMKGNGYTAAQLEWLSDALKVENGYNIIISVHVPPTTVEGITGCSATNDNILRNLISAYMNKETYTFGDVNVDYTSAGGNIVGVFAGHKHFDYTDAVTLPCPIIITTTASSTPQTDPNGNKDNRTYGTVNETAFDIVTVDTENKVIYMTRLGGGADRTINY